MVRKLVFAMTLVAIAALFPRIGETSCHNNVPPCVSIVLDRQLILLASSFTPPELTIQQPGHVFIQNFDDAEHTVTHVGCTDGDSATPCRFDKLIPANYNLMRAQQIFTGPPGSATYVPPGTYPYYCKNHGAPGSGMWGTLIVT